MNTEQELKGINAHLNSLYLEMNAIKARVEYLSKQSDNSDPNHYMPKVGEVVEVSDHKVIWFKKIFVEYIKDNDMNFNCVSAFDCESYRNGEDYPTNSWRYCRRLNGQIIEFGCDKPKQEVPPTPNADNFQYIDLLPESYEFCKEGEAEKLVKIKLINLPDEAPIGSVCNFPKNIVEKYFNFYRPIRKIHKESQQPDYSHLLPEGYEFCAEGEAEKWVKVELSPVKDEQYDKGIVVEIPPKSMEQFYRQIRKIRNEAQQPECNGAEHECKYCGAMTSQPDEQCYKNPYAVDWTNAPDWADVHCCDEDGVGYWCGMYVRNKSWADNFMKSPFTLPDGLDWKLSKTFRPR